MWQLKATEVEKDCQIIFGEVRVTFITERSNQKEFCMFGIGLPELFVICAIALVFIGPQKLPMVLRGLGKALVEFKRATNEFRDVVQQEMDKVTKETQLKEIKKDIEKDLGKVNLSLKQLPQGAGKDVGQQLENLATLMEKPPSVTTSVFSTPTPQAPVTAPTTILSEPQTTQRD